MKEERPEVIQIRCWKCSIHYHPRSCPVCHGDGWQWVTPSKGATS